MCFVSLWNPVLVEFDWYIRFPWTLMIEAHGVSEREMEAGKRGFQQYTSFQLAGIDFLEVSIHLKSESILVHVYNIGCNSVLFSIQH